MFRLLFTLSLLAIATVASAQQEIPGFIIKNSGDTVRGSLLTRKIATYECTFSAAGQSSETTYTPNDIIGFGNNEGRTFMRYQLKDLASPVFAEVYASGKMTLIEYYNRYFLDDKTDVIELEVVRTIVEKDGKQMEQISNKYLQTLTWKFADCPKAVEKIKTTTLSSKSLRKVFNIYNECFGIVANNQKKPFGEIIAGVEYGSSSTTLSGFSESYSQQYVDEKFKKSSTTFPGFFVQYRSPKNVVFQTGFQKYDFSFESEQLAYKNAGLNTTEQQWVTYKEIKVPLLVGYDFFHGNFRPFVRIGVNARIYTNKSIKREGYIIYPNPAQNIHNTEPLFAFRTRPISGQSEIGASYSIRRFYISARARYEFGNAPFLESEAGRDGKKINQSTISAALAIGFRIN